MYHLAPSCDPDGCLSGLYGGLMCLFHIRNWNNELSKGVLLYKGESELMSEAFECRELSMIQLPFKTKNLR